MNNSIFGKAIENVGKHRDIPLQQQKKEGTIWYLNQIIIQQSFSQKMY